ncbi:MAG: SH3 domain-containing protein [Clostridia bacterium]|nr:SH3 domain-containing protein [Clostridia bacterium]
MIKKLLNLALLALLCLLCTAGAAEGMTLQEAADTAESAVQFPFLAETDELAVNVRADMSTKAKRIARIERGTPVMVLAAQVNQRDEVWYTVELEDGTKGYIRSDLLVASEEMAIERAAYAAPEAAAKQLIGNRNTKKYHEPYCHTLPKEKNRIYFSSAAEAEKQGYVHCKNCD